MNKKIDKKQLYNLGDYISDFAKSYIIIGGTATQLLLEASGDNSRTTKDIDMVIVKGDDDKEFIKNLNAFLKAGEYTNYCRDDKKYFYRFEKPKNSNYPKMIEIFARDELKLDPNQKYTRINIEDSYYYLSGIILDDDFFDFIKRGVIFKDRLAILNYMHLIPLKMYAYNNLKLLNENEYDIQKHKTDVFNLCNLFKEDDRINLPEKIKLEVIKFIDDVTKIEDNEKIELLIRMFQL